MALPAKPPESALSILVVDDDPMLRKLLARVLERHGYRAVLAPDTASALDRCGEALPSLALVDLGLGTAEGTDFVEELRTRFGEDAPPIVLLTGREGSTQIGERVGAVATLAKPCHVAELLGVLRVHARARPRG